MPDLAPHARRAAYVLTAGSAVSILFYIAVSQILMALAFAALLASREPIRFPPLRLPLLLFFLGTVLSLVFSDDPRAGAPQIRKFYVFLIVLLAASVYSSLAKIRTTVLLWGGVAALSALRSFGQFAQKLHESAIEHVYFYQFYVGERITGFMSHWMTFGGEEMIVLLMLAAFLLFAPPSKWKVPSGVACVLLAVSMLLGLTRGIWLGTAAGSVYLLWFWRPRLLLALPPLIAMLLVFAPIRERVVSVFRPHGDLDSNQFRVVVWRTGLKMIEAHPWFGLGPEEVKAELPRYIPADIPRPLPSGWYGHLHNIYLHYAAERGIPVMLVLMWFLGKIGYDFARSLRGGPPPEVRWVLHGALAVLIAVLVEGFFELNLGDSEVLTMFLTATTFGYVARAT